MSIKTIIEKHCIFCNRELEQGQIECDCKISINALAKLERNLKNMIDSTEAEIEQLEKDIIEEEKYLAYTKERYINLKKHLDGIYKETLKRYDIEGK